MHCSSCVAGIATAMPCFAWQAMLCVLDCNVPPQIRNSGWQVRSDPQHAHVTQALPLMLPGILVLSHRHSWMNRLRPGAAHAQQHWQRFCRRADSSLWYPLCPGLTLTCKQQSRVAASVISKAPSLFDSFCRISDFPDSCGVCWEKSSLTHVTHAAWK